MVIRTWRNATSMAMLLLFAWSAPSFAAPIDIKMSLDSGNRVAVDQSFALSVKLTAFGARSIEGYGEPDTSAFELINKTSARQSQRRIVNGSLQEQSSITFTYTLMPKSVGRFKIGGARARSGKAEATASPIVIDVTASTGERMNSAQSMNIALSKTNAVPGEQIQMRVELLSLENIDITDVKFPSLDDFWVEKFDNGRVSLSERMQAGQRVFVYTISKSAIFPHRAGVAKIGPVTVQYSKGGGFFTRGSTGTVRSEPQTVEVMALPTQGRPSGFAASNIGTWRLEARLSSKKVSAGTPFTLKIIARGEGNASALKIDPPKFDEGKVRLFPPTETSKNSARDGKLFGTKTVELLVQPLGPGELIIPAVEMAIYTPDQGYDVLRTEPIRVTVTAGAGGSQNSAPAVQDTGAKLPSISLRPIKTDPAGGPYLHRSWAFRGVCVFLLLGYLFLRLVRSKPKDQAAHVAAKRKGAMDAAIASGDIAAVRNEMSRALAARYGRQAASLEGPRLHAYLRERGCEPDNISQLASWFSDVDAAAYAGNNSSAPAVLFDTARALFSVFSEGQK